MKTQQLTIALGADHRGFALKEWLKDSFSLANYAFKWLDCGAYTAERSDYPEFSKKVAEAILNKQADYGILLCGTGIGMAIAANRFKGIYAGLVWNERIARLAKEDDNVNVLVLPVDFISLQEAIVIVEAWITAEFNNGRYQQRLAMIDT